MPSGTNTMPKASAAMFVALRLVCVPLPWAPLEPPRPGHSAPPPLRPGLAQALDAVPEGDTLIVWKLDRLGRSVKDLLEFAGRLSERGIGFISLTDAIDTTTASGRFFFNVMASLAQMERELMVERTQAGLQAQFTCGGGFPQVPSHKAPGGTISP